MRFYIISCVLVIFFLPNHISPHAIKEPNSSRNLVSLTTAASTTIDEPIENTIKGLLKLPVAARDWQAPIETNNNQPLVLNAKKTIDENASLESLLGYWSALGHSDKEQPSENVRKRLLEGCEKSPEYLSALLKFLPNEPISHNRVKAIYDQEISNNRFSKEWKKNVHNWLMLNSNYFREDLIKVAQSASDTNGYIKNDDELKALARLDWDIAQPILFKFAAGKQPRLSTLATILLYEHSISTQDNLSTEKHRRKLKTTVENRLMAGYARDIACDAVMKSEWEGSEEWYLSLFKDPTFLRVFDKDTLYHPLSSPISDNPDYWIPKIVKLVGNTNRAIHNNAVSCLIGFQLEYARRDALLPLLPWLSNPLWADVEDRLRLIQSMDSIDIPESVPGLIWVVANDEDNTNRSYAADSLIRYHAPNALTALKKALTREKNHTDRRRIMSAIDACGGFTEDEYLKAIEAYATKLSKPNGEKEIEDFEYGFGDNNTQPVEISVGMYLNDYGKPDEKTSSKLLEHANSLITKNPTLAKNMFSIIHKWSGNNIDADIVRRLSTQ
ncbi:MAG: HEAT repeat domain-containing protein [Acidobacteria bacterium]|nr:HEAT repeat domain-containing protein [Acidobacteriota bacterium]